MNIDELQQKFNEMRKKKWWTVGGKESVEIAGFIRYGDDDCRIVVAYHRSGIFIDAETMRTYAGCEPFIEEVNPYADWPIDAKIRVWNLPDDVKEARHFAGVNGDGLPLAWVNGCTSHTTGITAVWSHAELAEDGE